MERKESGVVWDMSVSEIAVELGARKRGDSVDSVGRLQAVGG